MLKISALQDELATMGKVMAEHARAYNAAYRKLLRWWESAPDVATIRARLEADEEGFVPQGEGALQRFIGAPPVPPPETVVIGVDGSQIMPDHHAILPYYVIQVGGLIFRYDGRPPTAHRHALFRYREEELYDAEGYLISARQVGMQREAAELDYMLRLARLALEEGPPLPVIVLGDGPLLWPYSGRSEHEGTILQQFFDTLLAMRKARVMPVGFIERPGGRHLVRMLWKLFRDERTPSPPRLSDVAFLQHLLPPGQRTIWFLRRSSMQERYRTAGFPIWCCYVNVGSEGEPVIARVESPAYAAQRESWSTLMLSLLVHQSKPSAGHPYVLARAHELALITRQDKQSLERQIVRILTDYGFHPRASAKARQKAMLGKR